MKRTVWSRRRGEYEGLVWVVFGGFLLFGAMAMLFASRFANGGAEQMTLKGQPTAQPYGMGLSSEPGQDR